MLVTSHAQNDTFLGSITWETQEAPGVTHDLS